MELLGLELKQAREARGISMHEMAARTKISIPALECLERNDFSRLPGGIFGRAFVRAYAIEVGVDPDSAVTRFAHLLEQSEREAAARKAAMRPEVTLDDRQFLQRQQRALLILRIGLAAAAIAIVAVVVWQGRAYWQRRQAAKTAAAAPVETRTTTDTATPASAVTPQASAPMAEAVLPAPTAPATPAPASAAATGLVVEIALVSECWMNVSVDGASPSGAHLYQPGESHRFEADREILLDVGDASAVQVTINGQAAKPLGKPGAHVRTRITRDNAAAFLQ
jgi:cytoskeletal protein RodZ